MLWSMDFEETERHGLDGVEVSIVTAQTLYDMKRNTVRLKDRADAQLLKERFGCIDREDK